LYYCDICDRPLKKKNRLHGFTLCSKHMHQLIKYGFFKDNIQRTNKDFNDYIVKDGIATFNVYDQNNIKVGEFIVDAADIQKIKYKKWRQDSNEHIVTGNCTATNPRRELSRFLLDVEDAASVVDHINGNTRDNRRSNLRVCSQAENVCNKHFMSNNTSGFVGVMWDKQRKRWAPEIMLNQKRCHLGRYDIKENAIYARFVAEKIVFGEYRNFSKDKDLFVLFKSIPTQERQRIAEYVIQKLKSKNNLGN